MTQAVNPINIIGKSVKRGFPPVHPSTLKIPLPFSLDPVQQVSFNVLQGIRNVQGIGGIQSVFIDNFNNGQSVDLLFDTGYHISCPSYCQAIFPVFFSGELLSFIATSTGLVDITLLFTNTREQAQIWTTKIPLAGAVNVSGSSVFTQPLQGSFVDSSAAMAVGGTSQLLMAANGNRKIIAIRNPALASSQGIAAPEPAYINFGSPAVVNGTMSWELLPGETLPMFLATSTQAINFNAATTGHVLIAKYI